MKKRKESTEVLWNIRKEIPGFNKIELLEYLEWAIPRLYHSLVNKTEPEVKCAHELINKLYSRSLQYRITKDIDHVTVQYAELFDSAKKENEMYIQVYLSIYFYDKVENNINNKSTGDKYWNDIWIVTCKENNESVKESSNCVNCGAVMKYIPARDIFECEYCGNIIHRKTNLSWEIVDIELGN